MNTDLRFIDPTSRRNKSKIELAPRSMDIAGVDSPARGQAAQSARKTLSCQIDQRR